MWKPESRMPSGSNTSSCSNVASGCPDSTSSSLPRTSGQPSEAVHKFSKAHRIRAYARVGVEPVDLCVAFSVAKTGCVHEQIADSDLSACRHDAAVVHEDVGASKRRQMMGYRFIKL
eukprot:7384526-Prymnesium_polylepis.2